MRPTGGSIAPAERRLPPLPGHRPLNPTEWGFVVAGLLRVGDGVLIAATALLAAALRLDIDEVPAHYAGAVVVGVLFHLNAGQVGGLYRYGGLMRLPTQVGRVTLVWLSVAVGLVTLAYFTKTSEIFSRVWVASWFAFAYFGLLVNRVILAHGIARRHAAGELATRVAVVGDGPKAARVLELVEKAGELERRSIGLFSPPADTEGAGAPDEARGGFDQLLRIVKAGGADEVIIAVETDDDASIMPILGELSALAVDIKLAPDTVGLSAPALGLDHLGGAALLTVYSRPIGGWGRVLKRAEDLVLGALCLALAAPLMIVTAVLIKASSPGPVLFRQRRLGFHGNVFMLYKFRTMRARGPEDGEDGLDVPQARRGDPRVTPLGRLLRRASLDELPQLINVLKGEMSLVGPRPHAVSHNQEFAAFIDGYLGRHRVKPGMTGWAQINGFRGETDTEEKIRRRVELDLYYIDHWSLGFDLKILLLTIVFGFIQKNAY